MTICAVGKTIATAMKPTIEKSTAQRQRPTGARAAIGARPPMMT